ncbi:hypothetical protein DFH28DRAFT_492401 [Melampsora americana]|nr:hypothetical protein DFH28DRAFT_492401 [Melampsora americana]
MRVPKIFIVLNMLIDYHVCFDISTISSITYPTPTTGLSSQPVTAPKVTVKYSIIHEQYLRRTEISDQLQAQLGRQYESALTISPPAPIPQSPARRLGHFDDREDVTPPDVWHSETSQEVLTPTEPVPGPAKILGIDKGIFLKAYYILGGPPLAFLHWKCWIRDVKTFFCNQKRLIITWPGRDRT